MINQQIFLTITEQKSSKVTLPSLLLSAFSSINLSVSSSRFSLICLLISLRSFISTQPLLPRSYFLKIPPTSFFVSFKQGLLPIACMNSPKLIPPASSTSYQAMISYTVFLFGLKPFCVRRRIKSLGRRTPIPVESYVSNTYFKSITSSIDNCAVTQSFGSKVSSTFLLNLILYFSWLWLYLSERPSLFSGLNPNFSFFGQSDFKFANDLVFSLGLYIQKIQLNVDQQYDLIFIHSKFLLDFYFLAFLGQFIIFFQFQTLY